MRSGRRLLRNESGSLRDVMNCDRSSLTAFRSGVGEDDRPIGRYDGLASERIARSIVLAQIVLKESGANCSGATLRRRSAHDRLRRRRRWSRRQLAIHGLRHCAKVSSVRHVCHIFIDRPEFFIAHSSDRPPRHLLAEFVAVGIDAGAHGGDEFLKLPSFYKIEVGPSGASCPGTPPVNLSP
jgi:hypothetical protein